MKQVVAALAVLTVEANVFDAAAPARFGK